MKSEMFMSSMRSLHRAISVMNCFSSNELELSGSDIARKVGIPKTTAYRIISFLAEYGLLDKNSRTGKYTIGPALYALGSLYLSTADILKAADPVIKTLNELTSEAVSVGILDRASMILIMKEESKYAFRLTTHIGSILPAYASAMGKELLSQLPEKDLDTLIPEERLRLITKKTIATRTELKRELEQIRKADVSIDREGGYEGVESIACLIRGVSGKAVAAMSIPVPVFRMDKAYRERLTILVRMGASLISYRLGYLDSDNPVRDIKEINSWWEQNKPN